MSAREPRLPQRDPAAVAMSHWQVFAQGVALRHLKANATPETRDPDLEWPDPVRQFADFVRAGFCVRVNDADAVFELEQVHADVQALRQIWRAQVAHLHPAYARVLVNLLRAPGLQAVIEADLPSHAAPLRLDTGVPYPQCDPGQTAPFEYRYTPPSATTMVRERQLQLVFRNPLTPAQAGAVCTALESWVDVVWRSGFAPDDTHPGNAGTLPVAPYRFDPQTVAVDFEQIFRVDERCFDSVLAYAQRLVAAGLALDYVQVA